MRGILRKKDSGWVVQYLQPATVNQYGWLNADSNFRELPLVKEDFDIDSKMKSVVELEDGKHVEFEIIEYYAKII